ncbi:hypothetical protein AVEN_129481-1, partial [Araneus ventricosus]
MVLILYATSSLPTLRTLHGGALLRQVVRFPSETLHGTLSSSGGPLSLRNSPPGISRVEQTLFAGQSTEEGIFATRTVQRAPTVRSRSHAER